ncbi:hypothetical protein [Halococcoides cellulosivorans]|uniref:Uncharacterized protein n=1 Tax=Halococcoides cellulosivorans TaxID=1679096 RepID=A0A2R4X2G1_9EURY|nr:hypothetical protein [Halococcoides cellulosivorans]AWB27972.1 hypothetical protein HARCEL1_09760 [Halococcoides cellulosivorans]
MVSQRRRLAAWVANRSALPTAVQAAAGYTATTGDVDLGSLRLKRLVDRRTDRMVAAAFGVAEAAIADAFDADPRAVSFAYDTKLLLPAQLALGRVYRLARERADGDPVDSGPWADGPPDDPWTIDAFDGDRDLDPETLVAYGERVTRLVVQALLDGDMRDAINDREFEDFEVSVDGEQVDRERAARAAQRALADDLDEQFDRLPDAIRAPYDDAVAYSETHQDRDRAFRAHYRAATDGVPGAREAIEDEYRDATDPDRDFLRASPDLPYLHSQYARVGVIYEAMIDMYRATGVELSVSFERAVVLAIVGAQIWLDDLDDYRVDRQAGQLTPVTAEYVLRETDRSACRSILDVVEAYLDCAREHAETAESPLTGIAIEYIDRRGDPSVLPGFDALDR